MNQTLSESAPTLMWFRRDLRLSDHPALRAACARGAPVIPVFIRDPLVDALGTAPAWRLGLGLSGFGRRLDGAGSRLILRSGPALPVLRALIEETGARAVFWSRAYDAPAIARDTEIKAALRAEGIEARSLPGHLLFEPWEARTKQGGFFRVYTPFWRAVSAREVAAPLPVPSCLPAPGTWPATEALSDWGLGRGMNRGAAIVAPHLAVGEAAAEARLERFLSGPVEGYRERRDHPAEESTSRLSENLALGEISPRVVWHAGLRAQAAGAPGAGHFLRELVWREFAWHLLHHTPHIATRNWRDEWDMFPWRDDNPEAERWRRGQTGVTLVDAAMREMYVTGTMHNRGRMIVASYLTKHLLTHWRVGLRWFEECLVDWDPASNAMGWQWAAGSGAHPAPDLRIMDPAPPPPRLHHHLTETRP
ncbi:MAG: deoxyribodipyrimidine photo-lyase, partial [Rhodobacteraceae bacterium]|nr:deoxyribodipyrimidine photo-lyase [Paracoccaceae bacterium]